MKRMSKRDILRLLMFGAFALICLIQCYTIVMSFLDYPVVINTYDAAPGLLNIMPALTICNNNRFSLKKFVKRNSAFAQGFNKIYPGWFPNNQRSVVDKAEFQNFRDDVSRLMAKLNYNPQTAIDNTTLHGSFDIKPEPKDFIKWIGCARTWTESKDCDQLSRIESIQDRRCTTVLHNGAMYYDLLNRRHLFNSSSLTNHSYFDTKEVIKILLDFEPEDYGDLKRQIGARMIFHDSNYVASSSELDFYVTRGFKYDFSIEREDDLLLDEPYGNCYDYQSNFMNRYKRTIDPRAPLSINTCSQNCVVRNIISQLNCWPQSMPYFRNDSLDPKRVYRGCEWFREARHLFAFNQMHRVREAHSAGTKSANQSAELVGWPSTKVDSYKKEMQFYTKVRRHCLSKCALDCRSSRYSVTVTRTTWPADIKVVLDKTGKDGVKRHCCALITIKFAHFHHTIQEFQPKYNVIDTIGNIGGLLAVWLGFSIVSIYHAIQKLVEFIHGRSLILRTDDVIVETKLSQVWHTSRVSKMSHSNEDVACYSTSSRKGTSHAKLYGSTTR